MKRKKYVLYYLSPEDKKFARLIKDANVTINVYRGAGFKAVSYQPHITFFSQDYYVDSYKLNHLPAYPIKDEILKNINDQIKNEFNQGSFVK